MGRYDYKAFGEQVPQTPTLPNTVGFGGHVTDKATGLIYMNARYYDPQLARFISADSLVPDPLNPQAQNRYSYVYNCPTGYTDPSGHQPFTVIVDGLTWGAIESGEFMGPVAGPYFHWHQVTTTWTIDATGLRQVTIGPDFSIRAIRTVETKLSLSSIWGDDQSSTPTEGDASLSAPPNTEPASPASSTGAAKSPSVPRSSVADRRASLTSAHSSESDRDRPSWKGLFWARPLEQSTGATFCRGFYRLALLSAGSMRDARLTQARSPTSLVRGQVSTRLPMRDRPRGRKWSVREVHRESS